MNKIMKGIVDAVYGVQRVATRYQLAHPTEKAVASDACKAISTDTDAAISYGTAWLTARRAVLLLTTHKLVCGNWEIPLEAVASAQLLKIPATLGSGQVLKVATITGRNYQFGMQFNPTWALQQVLPMTLEKGHVRYSLFSTLVRISMMVYLLFWLYKHLLS